MAASNFGMKTTHPVAQQQSTKMLHRIASPSTSISKSRETRMPRDVDSVIRRKRTYVTWVHRRDAQAANTNCNKGDILQYNLHRGRWTEIKDLKCKAIGAASSTRIKSTRASVRLQVDGGSEDEEEDSVDLRVVPAAAGHRVVAGAVVVVVAVAAMVAQAVEEVGTAAGGG